jgi:nitroreductase
MSGRVLLDALLARQSHRPRRLKPPAPSPADLAQIAAAGLRAPDHGNLRPWRLIHVHDRQALADAFEAAEQELRPAADSEARSRARERALRGPMLVVLVANIRPDRPEVPEHEQWAAIGAALAQMLLAAAALGYGAGILSGRKTQTQALRNALGLADDESVVGFLSLGTPSVAPPVAAAPDPSRYIQEWPPSKR